MGGVHEPKNLNVFGYAHQIPSRFVDPNGEAPGEPYKTFYKALTDAELDSHKGMLETGLEHSGKLYQMPNQQFSYTEALTA